MIRKAFTGLERELISSSDSEEDVGVGGGGNPFIGPTITAIGYKDSLKNPESDVKLVKTQPNSTFF